MGAFSWRDEPTRREILAAFLGGPLALAAGCSRKKPPLPEGKIVGPSEGLAHRFRDGKLPPRPAEQDWEDKRLVIVGGGVAGLSAAWRLLEAGFQEFVLLEMETRPGGTSRYDESPVCSYPWGAHYLPVPMKENRSLVHLLRQMGIVERIDDEGEPVVGEEHLVRDPESRIWAHDTWYYHDEPYLHAGENGEDGVQLARFHNEVVRWVRWRDARGRRAFGLPMAMASDDAEVTALDRLSMADWMNQRGFTSPRLQWMVNYACRDDYGASLRDVSAWSGLFYFASRKRDSSLAEAAAGGSWLRPLASRRRKHELESQPFMVWPEGNGRLVKHFLARIERADRSILRTGLAVSEVRPLEGKPGVEVIAFDQIKERSVGFRAEQVIYCAPQFTTRYLIPSIRQDQERLASLAEFEYSIWFVANLHLKDRPAGSMLAWDNIIYDSPSLGYVTATHQLGSDHGPTVLTYYYPMTEHSPAEERKRLLAMDWRECADITLTDLERAHPDIRKLVQRLDVIRWGHAMPRPRPGMIWSGARARAARPHRGIHFAHSDLSGVGIMEEAYYQGIRAAEEVLTARGVRFQSIL